MGNDWCLRIRLSTSKNHLANTKSHDCYHVHKSADSEDECASDNENSENSQTEEIDGIMESKDSETDFDSDKYYERLAPDDGRGWRR